MSTYLGRFRWGDEVDFTVTPTGPPPALPTATITDASSVTVASFSMWVLPGLASFAGSVFLSSAWALGTFTVTCQFSVSGSPVTQVFTFDVVAGGDSGGDVISMYFYDRPEAGYVIAQLSGGLLAQGRNPHL